MPPSHLKPHITNASIVIYLRTHEDVSQLICPLEKGCHLYCTFCPIRTKGVMVPRSVIWNIMIDGVSTLIQSLLQPHSDTLIVVKYELLCHFEPVILSVLVVGFQIKWNRSSMAKETWLLFVSLHRCRFFWDLCYSIHRNRADLGPNIPLCQQAFAWEPLWTI